MKAFILVMLMFSIEGKTMCLPPSNSNAKSLSFDSLPVESAAREFTELSERNLPANEKLTIKFESLNSGINAEIIKSNSGPVITVLGGMIAHPKMNKNVLTLLLCHELGHYLGGPPLKSRNGWSSTEGQADYYSGEKCARELGMNEEDFLASALSLTRIYAEVTRETSPELDRCDETVVQRIFYGYPKVQCRLDTIIAGWKNERRPACWYVE